MVTANQCSMGSGWIPKGLRCPAPKQQPKSYHPLFDVKRALPQLLHSAHVKGCIRIPLPTLTGG